MVERALSFGAAAADYERFRPCYPDELVDRVVDYADRDVRTALEIGAGTGKATRVFARRGIAVTATEPDAGMLAELRKHVPETVATVQAAFEDLPISSSYDLVFAAASLHWTDAATRWPRIAALLVPGGTFASFGGQLDLADDVLRERVDLVSSRFVRDGHVPFVDTLRSQSGMAWPGDELSQADEFEDVRQQTIERQLSLSADEFVGHLSTISAYRQLPNTTRAAALEQIREVLPDTVTVTGDIILHLARRV